MRLTPEQRKAIDCEDHAVVVACPGSGKTRTLIAKLIKCIEDVRGSPRRVGCITYTNTAVHEIEHRLRLYGTMGDDDYCDISTIHAFCQTNVLRHFYWKLQEYKNGYVILPPDSEIYAQIVKQIADKYRLGDYAQSQFELLNRRPDGSPISSEIPPIAAYEFWAKLQNNSFIDFSNIVYLTYRILKDNPSVARAMACKFAHILVDEFQDTSALQVEILSIIAKHDITRFFLVGDPEQSIYSFAGGDPKLMFTFANAIKANDDAKLLGNFRSSKPVVSCAEKIRPRQPKMYSARKKCKWVEEPTHVSTKDYFEAITDHFLPSLEALEIGFGEAAILSPQWPILRPLAGKLRDYHVPVVGPGARPYKRSHLFARFAEQVCAYIESPRPELVRQAEKELFNLVLDITRRAEFSIYSFAGRRLVFTLFGIGRRILHENESGTNWLRQASREMGEAIHEAGFLPSSASVLLQESVEAMLLDMTKARVDIAQLSISDLGMFADPTSSLKLMTIHTSKGREFDAVAIIGLHDGIIPYYNDYKPLTAEGDAEARRLFYVAATRARRVLLFLSGPDARRTKCRYLSEMGF